MIHQAQDEDNDGAREYPSVVAFGRFHEFDQHTVGILRVDEDDQRAVGADTGLAQHRRAALLHFGRRPAWMSATSKQTWCWPPVGFFLRKLVIGDFSPSGSISSIWLLGRFTKQTLTPCSGMSNGVRDVRRAIERAVRLEGLLDVRHGDADMVQRANLEFTHAVLSSSVQSLL